MALRSSIQRSYLRQKDERRDIPPQARHSRPALQRVPALSFIQNLKVHERAREGRGVLAVAAYHFAGRARRR